MINLQKYVIPKKQDHFLKKLINKKFNFFKKKIYKKLKNFKIKI